jgi:hypothetical protein
MSRLVNNKQGNVDFVQSSGRKQASEETVFVCLSVCLCGT